MGCSRQLDGSAFLSVDKSVSQNPLLSLSPESWTTNPMHFGLHEHDVSHSGHFPLIDVDDMVNSPILSSTTFSMIFPSAFAHLPGPTDL